MSLRSKTTDSVYATCRLSPPQPEKRLAERSKSAAIPRQTTKHGTKRPVTNFLDQALSRVWARARVITIRHAKRQEPARENKMSHIDRRAISLLGLAAILSPLGALAAETYPSRPIHLIVGFTAGATSDIIARIFAKAADPLLGQNVVVENKPGAGSSIAAEYVARSVNDGYTLFVPTLSTLTDEIVNPDRSTHLGKDFSPIALLGSIAIVLIVAPNADVRSVSELIALAKSKPGKLSYGSVGAGTLLHLAGVLFAQRAGIQLLHVPYPGSPQAVEDVVAGRITMLFAPASSIIGQVGAGKVLALATAAENRSSALPEGAYHGGSRNAQFRH